MPHQPLPQSENGPMPGLDELRDAGWLVHAGNVWIPSAEFDALVVMRSLPERINPDFLNRVMAHLRAARPGDALSYSVAIDPPRVDQDGLVVDYIGKRGDLQAAMVRVLIEQGTILTLGEEA